MEKTSKPRIKICCISSEEEAKLAIQYGASAIGLVGNMPSGPGIIKDEMIFKIARSVPPPIATFLLSSETTAENLIAHHKKVNTSTIQIVDALSNKEYHTIREALPTVKLIQVIHVADERSVQEALDIAPYVDAILLDSGNPKLKVKVLGGTGRTHNWELSRGIREKLDIPIFLAGGINPGNIREALDTVHPFGIDLCSGVRTDGKLDEQKLQELFHALES
jgi:phosphoribosylanthranilate isomerase